MTIYTISDSSELKDDVLETNRDALLFVTFYTPQNPDSTATLLIAEKLSNTTKFDEVDFYKIDVDETPELAEEYGVKTLPTCLFLKGGKVVDRIVGMVGEGEIVAKIVENN